jgi:hypothetical protein
MRVVAVYGQYQQQFEMLRLKFGAEAEQAQELVVANGRKTEQEQVVMLLDLWRQVPRQI